MEGNKLNSLLDISTPTFFFFYDEQNILLDCKRWFITSCVTETLINTNMGDKILFDSSGKSMPGFSDLSTNKSTTSLHQNVFTLYSVLLEVIFSSPPSACNTLHSPQGRDYFTASSAKPDTRCLDLSCYLQRELFRLYQYFTI